MIEQEDSAITKNIHLVPLCLSVLACVVTLGVCGFVWVKILPQQQSLQNALSDLHAQTESVNERFDSQLADHPKELSREQLVGKYSQGSDKNNTVLTLNNDGGFSIDFFDAMEDKEYHIASGVWDYYANNGTLTLLSICGMPPCFNNNSKIGLPDNSVPMLTFLVLAKSESLNATINKRLSTDAMLMLLNTGTWNDKALILNKN